MSRAGLGAAGACSSAPSILGPVVARPAAAVLGAASSRLPRCRRPARPAQRDAQSAADRGERGRRCMVGTAVVALFTTFGASIKASIEDTVDSNFSGDLVILPDGFSGSLLSPELAPALSEVEGVNEAVGAAYGPADRRWQVHRRGRHRRPHAQPGVRRRRLVGDRSTASPTVTSRCSERYADDHALRLGSTIPMRWIDGATTDFSVAAIYEDRMTFGDLLISSADMAEHVAQPQITVVLVDVADGADPAAVKSAVDRSHVRVRRPRPDGPGGVQGRGGC